MKFHLTIYTLVGLAILILVGTTAARQPQLEEATFYVTWYDVGKSALEGRPGVKKVTRGFRGFKEINTVTYDPNVISVDEMAEHLQDARTLIDVAK